MLTKPDLAEMRRLRARAEALADSAPLSPDADEANQDLGAAVYPRLAELLDAAEELLSIFEERKRVAPSPAEIEQAQHAPGGERGT
jgi:hypothetical protein